MAIGELPILSMLRTRMQWHQERQRLLAENVANADTPQFRPRDLAPLNLQAPIGQVAGVRLVRTDPSHLGAAAGASEFPLQRNLRNDIRPMGNAVNLDEEMMKVAANQIDYQAATTLYTRSLGLLKTALSKR